MSELCGNLNRLAAAVLQPGFVGVRPPDWVRRWLGDGLGAVVLFARNIETPTQVAALTAALRAENPDILVAIDEEAGDVTRLESRRGSSRPGNLALGTVDDVELTAEVARDLGRELAGVGVNFNYAPDADVNSDPNNPVIGVRSFGSDPSLVARHTVAWVRGLQSAGVAACAKHFPGHGNTNVDSHHDLPYLNAGRAELARCELIPFQAAIRAGVQAVMTGHLVVSAYDPDTPATMSRDIVTGLLRRELGYQGLVVTDGIEMRAVADRYGMAKAAVGALAAGVDAICVGGEHADEATARMLRSAIVAAVISGELPEERLVEAAGRVRRLARWAAAHAADRAEPVSKVDAIDSGGHHANGSSVGLAAARRAVRVQRGIDATVPLTAAPHVVEFTAACNIAVGTQTPWGLAEPLSGLLPGTTTARVDAIRAGDPNALASVALAPAEGRPLVLVVRDEHRYEWMSTAVTRLLSARPDAIVVEMGLPALLPGRVHLATYGATRANAQAAAELLAQGER